jgi:hypothetical protein
MAAEITARRTAATTEYKRARPTDRRSAELVEGTPVRIDSLCLAADISAALFQEKEDNSLFVGLPAIDAPPCRIRPPCS